MRIYLLSLLYFITCFASAQEDWLHSSNPLIEYEVVKKVIPIVNNQSGEFAMFYEIKKGFVAELYNNKKELLHSLFIENAPSGEIVGYIFKDQQYTLFFSNTSMKKISCVRVDFTTGSTHLIEDIDITFKSEKPIQFITNDSGLHLLTIKKNSSIFNLYSFDQNGNYQEKSFDLSDEIFERDNGITYNLYSFLYIVHKVNVFEFIDNSLPCSLEQAVAPSKIFSNQNEIILTINLTDKYTYFIKLDIENSNFKFKKIENNHFIKNNYTNTHSSFLIEDVLIDSYISNEKLVINFIDINENASLKEYVITEKDSIHFKNTPIIFEGGDFADYRELEKTSQFIRKVIHSKLALSAYKTDKNYVVTLGSYEPKPGTWSMVGGIIGGATGAIIFYMFDSYTNSKSVRILSLLDENFNHIQGEIPQNGFDKINDFLTDKKFKKMEAQTIFKYENHFIWGGFDYYSGVYNFFKF